MRYSEVEWSVKFVKTIGDLHKYHGYIMIALSQTAISLGMLYYLFSIQKKALGIGLCVGNLGLYLGVVVTLEVLL